MADIEERTSINIQGLEFDYRKPCLQYRIDSESLSGEFEVYRDEYLSNSQKALFETGLEVNELLSILKGNDIVALTKEIEELEDKLKECPTDKVKELQEELISLSKSLQEKLGIINSKLKEKGINFVKAEAVIQNVYSDIQSCMNTFALLNIKRLFQISLDGPLDKINYDVEGEQFEELESAAMEVLLYFFTKSKRFQNSLRKFRQI